MSFSVEPPEGTIDRLLHTLAQLSEKEPGSDVEFSIGPAVPVYSLDYNDIVSWNLEGARLKLWRYLVSTTDEDILVANMKADGVAEFSGTSRGHIAQTYRSYLFRLADLEFSAQDFQEVRVLDIPTYSTLALWVKGQGKNAFFPIKILGRLIEFSQLPEDSFRERFVQGVIDYQQAISNREIFGLSPNDDFSPHELANGEAADETDDDNPEDDYTPGSSGP